MSEYCKAYKLSKLRQFPGWVDQVEKTNDETSQEATERKQTSELFSEDDYLFLHDTFIVTNGIFEDQNIIFNNVSQEWKQFCMEQLKFEIPKYEVVQPQQKSNTNSG